MVRIDPKITRFQSNLSTFRKVAGWTAEDLGNKLDLSRQTIMNLETKKIQMTKVQYIAFRSIFEAEAAARPNETLGQVISILVDHDDIPEKQKEELKETVDAAVSRVGPRAGIAAASKSAISALEVLGAFASIIPSMLPLIVPSALWIQELISENKK